MSTGTFERAGALGAAALGVDLAHDAILGTVRDVHGAVAGRVHAIGDLVTGNRTTIHGNHPGISSAVYAGIGYGLRATSRGLRAADRAVTDAGIGRPLEATPGGRFTVAALNGIFGDRIHEEHPGLDITMALRRDDADVAPTRSGLAAAYPDATSDLVVFLHGLIETEEVWRRSEAERGTTYADELEALGWTALVVRSNSGLSIARNGVELAGLLDAVVEGWPVPVRRIALVGHSLGGLVVRTACVVETDAPEPWTELVTDVVTLGTPHLGAPIAQLLTRGSAGLSRLPESAPFGRFLDHRSTSILDLEKGLPPDVLAAAARALPPGRGDARRRSRRTSCWAWPVTCW